MTTQINKNFLFFLVTCFVFYGLYVSWNIISPFVGSFVVAYLLSPLASIISKKARLPRWLVSLLLVLSLFIIFILIWVTLIPHIYEQIAHFAANIKSYKAFLKANIYPKVQKLIYVFDSNLNVDLSKNLDNIFSIFFQGGVDLVNKIWKSGYAVVNVLTAVFLVPLVSFYMIRDWEKIHQNVISLVPMKNRVRVQKLLSDINKSLSGFIRGQLNICLMLAIYYSAALTLVGLKYGIFIGITTGIISFIPFIGLTSGFITSIIVAYFQYGSWKGALSIIVVFVIGNIIESLLSPRIVGNKVGLHPVWVVFALVVGASTLGFFGMLVAIPIAAIIGVLVKFFIEIYKDSGYFGKRTKKK